MSTEFPSYANSGSSFALPEFERCDVAVEPFVDGEAYRDSYMGVGGRVDTDAGHTPLLEKDYCTNFTCCGLTLADLHELVGHFEECHVMVVSPNGGLGGPTGFPASLGMHMGVGSFVGTQIGTGMGPGMGTRYDTCTPTDEPYSAVTPQSSTSSSAPSSAPSSSLNSPVSSYISPSPNPNRFPTLTSGFSPSETRKCESAFASVTIATEGYDYNGGAAKEYLATHAQNHAQNFSNEQQVLGLSFDTLLHPSAYAISTSLPPAAPASVVPEHTVYATSLPPSATTESSLSLVSAKTAVTDAAANSMNPIAPTPVYARHPSLSIITDLPSGPTSNPNQNGRTADRNSNSKKRRPAPTKGALRQREKTHKCPRPGCIKSYLNFNGLKYHLEKGTCDFGQN